MEEHLTTDQRVAGSSPVTDVFPDDSLAFFVRIRSMPWGADARKERHWWNCVVGDPVPQAEVGLVFPLGVCPCRKRCYEESQRRPVAKKKNKKGLKGIL
ncbi:hypothetical protein LSM04_009447 [Trypanosoma melophagium]|uniref:uncharacterized protein n=1 Tax=Trypanosoma melophagium TaxID=715481 RepID=UPI00351A05CB|nr:hypothetical protein LSM04_009447 [Trypanosoma melophagium]